MASHRLSRLAAEDLMAIATYGLEQFGLEQSLKYRDGHQLRLSDPCPLSS